MNLFYYILCIVTNPVKDQISKIIEEEIKNSSFIKLSNEKIEGEYLLIELHFDELIFYKTGADLENKTLLINVDMSKSEFTTDKCFLNFLEEQLKPFSNDYEKVVILDYTDWPHNHVKQTPSQSRPLKSCLKNRTTSNINKYCDKELIYEDLKASPSHTSQYKKSSKDSFSSKNYIKTTDTSKNTKETEIKNLKAEDSTQTNESRSAHIFKPGFTSKKKLCFSSRRTNKFRFQRLFQKDMRKDIETFLKMSKSFSNVKMNHFLFLDSRAFEFFKQNEADTMFVYNHHDVQKCIIPIKNNKTIYFLIQPVSNILHKNFYQEQIRNPVLKLTTPEMINKIDKWFPYDYLVNGYFDNLLISNAYILVLLVRSIDFFEKSKDNKQDSAKEIRERIFDLIFFNIINEKNVIELFSNMYKNTSEDSSFRKDLEILGIKDLKKVTNQRSLKTKRGNRFNLWKLNEIIDIIFLINHPGTPPKYLEEINVKYKSYINLRNVILEIVLKGLGKPSMEELSKSDEFISSYQKFFMELEGNITSKIYIEGYKLILKAIQNIFEKKAFIFSIHFYFRLPDKQIFLSDYYRNEDNKVSETTKPEKIMDKIEKSLVFSFC